MTTADLPPLPPPLSTGEPAAQSRHRHEMAAHHATRFAPAEDTLAELTPSQRRAVTHGAGPMLVIAGPGSGKTRVITRRIAHLINTGTPPWRILAVTFTNKAAAEMRRRVSRILTGDEDASERALRGLTISTFHALCARLLRRFIDQADAPGLTPRYSIYSASDQRALMKRVVADSGMSSSNFQPASVLSTISDAKNRLLDARAFAVEASDFYARSVARLFTAYERALRAADAVDFDDLLLLTVRALERSDAMRSEVTRRWSHLLVDEYQDTNRAQFLLTTLLAGASVDRSLNRAIHHADDSEDNADKLRAPNLCVVGDPDQSIYGWRGADISNILDFEQVYPGARVVTLGENFRSTAKILAAADAVIQRNTRRKHKALVPTRESGEAPTLRLCEDEHDEAREVVKWASELQGREGVRWSDIAIFYRVNALSRVLEEELRSAGVPYIIARGTAFYEREEVRDAISYMRVVANPADDTALRRIINKPARGLGATSIKKIAALAQQRDLSLYDAIRTACSPDDPASITDRARKAAGAFVDLIEGFREGDAFLGEHVGEALGELVERIVRETGLERHYSTSKKRGEEAPDEEKLENLAELVTAASEFDIDAQRPLQRDTVANDDGAAPASDLPPELLDDILADKPVDGERTLLAALRAYLETIALVADADKVDPAQGAITLMTLHAAKGLEFKAAAIVGLEEGLLPHARARDNPMDLEEERRLFFVGMTRAMDHLLMTSCVMRTHRGMRQRTIPSLFLEEVPEEDVTRIDTTSGSFGPVDPLAQAANARAEPSTPTRSTGETGRRVVTEAEEALEAMGLRKGSRVQHPRFGVGEIEQILLSGFGGPRVKVRFRDLGVKTLLLSHAPLEVVR